MLYETYHLELDYDKIIFESLVIEKEAIDRDYISNKNGGVQIHERAWRSLPYSFYIDYCMIYRISKHISAMEGYKVDLYAWLNINYPGSYNSSHTHSGCKRSAVYYVKTPEDCGNLIFTNSDKEVEPKPGMLITFDSSAKHAVTPNFSDDTRISFAFNY